MQSAFDLASDIASKSPVAVQGTKINLVYSRDHSVPEGLKYMVSGGCPVQSLGRDCKSWQWSCAQDPGEPRSVRANFPTLAGRIS